MSLIGLPVGAAPDGGILDGEGPVAVQSPLDALAANPSLIPLYLLIASPYDPVAADTTTIYYATGEFTSASSDTPADQEFEENRISVPVELSNNLGLDRGRLIATGATAGEIVLSNMVDGDRIDDLAGYLWDGRPVKVLIGFPDYTLAQCAPIFTGTAEGVRWDEHRISFWLRSPRFRLERDIQTTVYAGATSATGTDIGFTSPSTISSTSTDLSGFAAGVTVQVSGSAGNSGFLTVGSSTATSITLSGGTVSTEAAGSSVTIRTVTEGGTELAGRCKPLLYGQVRQVAPVLIDGLNLLYQLHDGEVQAIGAVRDRGVGLTFSANYASARLLLAASISAGQYGTCLAEGLIRLGATAAGIVTAEVQGDAAGSLGSSGYTSTAADIVRKIATTQGDLVDPDDLDAGSFEDLAAAQPAVVGVATGLAPVKIAEVLDSVAGSVGAFIDFTRAGLLKIVRLVDPTTATAVRTITSVAPLTAFQGVSADLPAHSVKVGYRRYPQTLSGEEVGTSVADATRFDYGQALRYVTVDSSAATILAKHPSASLYEVETLLDVSSDASTEATRLQGLYEKSRKTYSVEAWNGLYGYELGDVVSLAVPRYGLDAGVNYVVLGYREAPASDEYHENRVSLTLWGGS